MGACGAVRLVWNQVSEVALQAEAAADRNERVGADDAVGVVVDAGVYAALATVAAVPSGNNQLAH